MKVNAIQSFVKKKDDEWSSFDCRLAAKIEKHFQNHKADAALNDSDFAFLKNIFIDRYNIIKYTNLDYTLATPEKNSAWLDLARTIATARNTNLLQTLIPHASNRYDPHSFKQASTISDLRNIMLFRYDGRLLWQDVRELEASALARPSLVLVKQNGNLRKAERRPLPLAILRLIARKDCRGLLPEADCTQNHLWRETLSLYQPKKNSQPTIDNSILKALLNVAELAVGNPSELNQALAELDTVLAGKPDIRDRLYRETCEQIAGQKQGNGPLLPNPENYRLLDILCLKIHARNQTHRIDAARALALYVYGQNKSICSQSQQLQSAYPSGACKLKVPGKDLIKQLDALHDTLEPGRLDSIPFSIIFSLQNILNRVLAPLPGEKHNRTGNKTAVFKKQVNALIANLTEDEKDRLSRQRMRTTEYDRPFSKWFEDLKSIEDEAHAILQLLVDYRSNLVFHPFIEHKYNMKNKRYYSRTLSVDEERERGNLQLIRHIKQLFLAIVSPPYALTNWTHDSRKIYFWDKSYTVPTPIHNIFKVFSKSLTNDKYTDPHGIFQQIEGRLRTKPTGTFWTEVIDTFFNSEKKDKIWNWLDNVRDGYIFCQRSNPWYSLPQLLYGLYPLTSTPSDLPMPLTKLLDDIYHTMGKQKFGCSFADIELRANILFREYLVQLNRHERTRLLQKLEATDSKGNCNTWLSTYRKHIQTEIPCKTEGPSQRHSANI